MIANNKKLLKPVACILATSLLTTSCIGSFTLFNKLAKWNRRATDSNFLNEFIFILISPAYGIATFVDACVLNSIEFWTGENPLANNIGKTKKIRGKDGIIYAVKYLKSGYEITKPEGDIIYLTYNKNEDSWYMTSKGKETKLIHFNGDGTIKAFLKNGLSINVTPDAYGVYELKQAQAGTSYFLANR